MDTRRRTDVSDLLAHLDASVSPAHSVESAANRLLSAGLTEVSWAALATGLPDMGFVRDSGLLLAWRRGSDKKAGFRIVGAHTDSPVLKVKPRPDVNAFGWRQLGVEVYGGILNNSWLDRDLGLAGRVVATDGNVRLLDVREPLARVPQLAVHLDRDVNDRGLVLDKQTHLTPVWGIGASSRGDFREFLGERLGVDAGAIASFDLSFYDITPAAVLGSDRSMIASGRLDNQVSCWAAVDAITKSQPGGATAVVALFDHEEVGSESAHGASGPRLEWLLAALDGRSDSEFRAALAVSTCVSADNAHAVHPNYPERHEPDHRPMANQGPVLKQNANQRYATSPESAAVFVSACERAGVPHQVFVTRNNMPCGSTIGPITATRLGISTVDVGVPQLSMHSARELCGVEDPAMLASALTTFLS